MGRQVEGAHLVPVGAFLAEAFGGDAGAFGEDPSGLAAVGLQDRVVGRQAGDEFAGQGALVTGGEGEPDIGALPNAVQQAAIAQQLQVARKPRLRLPEDFGKLHDAERAPSSQREQAKAGGFGGGAKAGEQVFHG